MNIILPLGIFAVATLVIIILISLRSKVLGELEIVTKKLNESNRLNEWVINSLQDVYYKTDMNGIILVVSPSIEHYIGQKPQEIVGKNAAEFYANSFDRLDLIEKISKTGTVSDYRIKLKGGDRKLIPTSLTGHIVFNEDKKPIAIEGILHELPNDSNA